jgi:hypothetical protein
LLLPTLVLSAAAVVVLAPSWAHGWDIVIPLLFGLAFMCVSLLSALDAANRLRTRRRFVRAVLEDTNPELSYQTSDGGDVILHRTVDGTAYQQTEVATVLVQV